jgi:hypothetical protein
MIDRDTFDSLLREHTVLGGKMLASIGSEITRHLRGTYQVFGREAS